MRCQHHTASTSGYYRGAADELLDLVDRRCRLFLAVGSLVRCHEERVFVHPRTRDAAKRRFLELLEQAGGAYSPQMLHQVAAEFRVNYQSVVRMTAPFRKVTIRGPRHVHATATG